MVEILPPGLVLLIGLAVLSAGAEILVRNAIRLSSLFGISRLMVGLTVVALGTSTPELAISLKSVFSGVEELALGNVLGSNILNILLILGVAATIRPVRVSAQLIRMDVPVMCLVSIAVLVLAIDGRISRSDGGLLALGSLVYGFLLFRAARRDHLAARELFELDPPQREDQKQEAQGNVGRFLARVFSEGSMAARWLLPILRVGLLALGIYLLVRGASLMVDGAVELADRRGLSPLVVGLTILALGTSLPELATSTAASIRGESDIAAGNVVGSNLLNLLVVLGVTALLAPNGIAVPAPALVLDLPVMVVVALASLPILFTGHVISRGEGILFLFYYVAYTTYLILKGTRVAEPLEQLIVTASWFVVPFTIATLLILMWRERRRQHLRARSPRRHTKD
jgi:cation:H+ antiporter